MKMGIDVWCSSENQRPETNETRSPPFESWQLPAAVRCIQAVRKVWPGGKGRRGFQGQQAGATLLYLKAREGRETHEASRWGYPHAPPDPEDGDRR
jgi:hypothetical protein